MERLPQVFFLGVESAFPSRSYTQTEVFKKLRSNGPHQKSFERFFNHPHIQKRHLSLEEMGESNAQMIHRFLVESTELTQQAVGRLFEKLNVTPEQIDFVCCISSTGFVVPSLSARLFKDLGLRANCERLDVVSMGCNAGLNGLKAVKNWCADNPRRKGLLICAEICSAIYCLDGTENTDLVNSLFGDAVAVALFEADAAHSGKLPFISQFQSYLIPDSLHMLRFDYKDDLQRNCFFIDKKTPETLARHIEIPIKALLAKEGFSKEDLDLWVVHTGGAAILDAIEKKLELSPEALFFTRETLKNYGNISSASFLVTYQLYLESPATKKAKNAAMITMGPGLTIESAVMRW